MISKLRKKFSHLPQDLRENLIEGLSIVEETLREEIHSKIFREIRDAIRKTEERLERVEKAIEKLADAQRRTEERVGRLEEAVERLAEAQRKTEEEIARLSRDMRKLKKEVGGLSNTVGYTLENEAMKALPSLLEKDFGIKVEGRFVRESLELPDGRETDVNILGFGRKNGKEIVIVGEAKVQLGKKHIEKFRRKVDNVFAPYFGKEIFPLMVTHYATKSVLRTAKKNGIVVYFSYQF